MVVAVPLESEICHMVAAPGPTMPVRTTAVVSFNGHARIRKPWPVKVKMSNCVSKVTAMRLENS